MTKKINFTPYKDKETAQFYAAKALSQELESLFHQNTPVLLLFSGGSAFALLDEVNASALSSNVTLGVLDERYSEDPTENNFAQLMDTLFYAKAEAAGGIFIDTRVKSNESQLTLARRFEAALRIWRESNPDGKIVITLGIGPDGHTSGVLPFPEDEQKFEQMFMNPESWVVAYEAKSKNPYPLRVTTTLAFLECVDVAILFACGENKRDALASATSSEGTIAQTPAKVIQRMRGVSVFTDVA